MNEIEILAERITHYLNCKKATFAITTSDADLLLQQALDRLLEQEAQFRQMKEERDLANRLLNEIIDEHGDVSVSNASMGWGTK